MFENLYETRQGHTYLQHQVTDTWPREMRKDKLIHINGWLEADFKCWYIMSKYNKKLQIWGPG